MRCRSLTGVATLVLISLGLAVIFGMMRVINLAHGEFLMLGGYAAIAGAQRGRATSGWRMLVVPPLVVGLVGAIVERLLIRRLYGRMIDTMLATWGLSLALIGGVTMVFGNTISGFSAPLGSFAIGAVPRRGYEHVPDRSRPSCCRRDLGGAALSPCRPDRARHHAERRTWRRPSASRRSGSMR